MQPPAGRIREDSGRGVRNRNRWLGGFVGEGTVLDDLLARGSLALPALVRARVLLQAALWDPHAGSVARAAACLRRSAVALQDAADALELWADWAELLEGRFGEGRGRS